MRRLALVGLALAGAALMLSLVGLLAVSPRDVQSIGSVPVVRVPESEFRDVVATGAPTPFPTPSQTVRPTASPILLTATAAPAGPTLSGVASWYRWRPGEAAAGPALRTGDWRGRTVTVCADRCVTVRLTDWCACYGSRLIDLDARSFAALAPLSAGLVRVQITSGQ